MLERKNTKTYVFHTKATLYTDKWLDYLNERDRLYTKKIKDEKRLQTFVAGRFLLASALEKLNGSTNYQLSYNSLGKPSLVSPKGWFFNITHSSDFIFLAIQKNGEIGIDSEILKSRNFSQVAKKVFTHKDYQSVINAKQPLRQFYKFWTRHEAQVKQLGLSVFSDIPADYSPHLYSYQFDNSLFTLCSQHEITKLIFLSNTESDDFKDFKQQQLIVV